MSLLSIRLLAEPVRTLDFGVIGPAYMGIGTAFDHPDSILFVQNLTDETLMFSLDGVNDHFPLPSDGFLLLDVVANKSRGEGLFISQGTRMYVKDLGVAPTVNAVYVSVFYGTDN